MLAADAFSVFPSLDGLVQATRIFGDRSGIGDLRK
jgi:hypothetical protein